MDLIMKKDPRIVVAKDYNYSCTKLQYKEDGRLFLSFTCFYFNEIFSRAGNYMIHKYYKDYTIEATEVGFHLTFSFDNQYAKEEPKIQKNATEAEKAEIQELKLQIRAENQKLFEKVTKDFSQIRRNLYAAVFEQAFDQIYQSRENEVVYAIPDKDVMNIALKYHFLIMQIEHQLIQQLQKQLMLSSKFNLIQKYLFYFSCNYYYNFDQFSERVLNNIPDIINMVDNINYKLMGFLRPFYSITIQYSNLNKLFQTIDGIIRYLVKSIDLCELSTFKISYKPSSDITYKQKPLLIQQTQYIINFLKNQNFNIQNCQDQLYTHINTINIKVGKVLQL